VGDANVVVFDVVVCVGCQWLALNKKANWKAAHTFVRPLHHQLRSATFPNSCPPPHPSHYTAHHKGEAAGGAAAGAGGDGAGGCNKGRLLGCAVSIETVAFLSQGASGYRRPSGGKHQQQQQH